MSMQGQRMYDPLKQAPWFAGPTTPAGVESPLSVSRAVGNTRLQLAECHEIFAAIESCLLGSGSTGMDAPTPAPPQPAPGLYQMSMELVTESERLRLRLEQLAKVLAP